MSVLVKGTILGGRYEIDCDGPIGKGTHACYYRAKDGLRLHRPVLVKVEALPTATSEPRLHIEAGVVKYLQRRPGCPGITRLVEFRETDVIFGNSFMVLENLGESLTNILQGRQKRVSKATMAFLGLQLLSAIEGMHHRGILHRSLSLKLFRLGQGGEDRLSVYITDFSQARRHLDNKGNPQRKRDTGEFVGAAWYASVTMHRHEDCGRVDDLWSLCYSLLELCVGYLPWSSYKARADLGLEQNKAARKQVQLKKEQLTTDILQANPASAREESGFLSRVPRPMIEFMQYLAPLGYSDLPNYNLLRSFLSRIGTDQERRRAASVDLCISAGSKLPRAKKVASPQLPDTAGQRGPRKIMTLAHTKQRFLVGYAERHSTAELSGCLLGIDARVCALRTALDRVANGPGGSVGDLANKRQKLAESKGETIDPAIDEVCPATPQSGAS